MSTTLRIVIVGLAATPHDASGALARLRAGAMDPLARLNLEAKQAMLKIDEAAANEQTTATATDEPTSSPSTRPPKQSLAARPALVRLVLPLGSATVAAAVRASRRRARRAALRTSVAELCQKLSLTPPPPDSSDATMIEQLERLRFCEEHIWPACKQLEEHPPRSKVMALSVAELEHLRDVLVRRVEACSRVLEAYVRLGQSAPPTFRSWPVETLDERTANITAKEGLLRRVGALQAQLGSRRLDWGLPAWDDAALEEHIAALESQLEDSRERKEREELLGKLEARYWMSKKDPPIGLPTMSTQDLKQLLKQLQSAGEEGLSDEPAE